VYHFEHVGDEFKFCARNPNQQACSDASRRLSHHSFDGGEADVRGCVGIIVCSSCEWTATPSSTPRLLVGQLRAPCGNTLVYPAKSHRLIHTPCTGRWKRQFFADGTCSILVTAPHVAHTRTVCSNPPPTVNASLIHENIGTGARGVLGRKQPDIQHSHLRDARRVARILSQGWTLQFPDGVDFAGLAHIDNVVKERYVLGSPMLHQFSCATEWGLGLLQKMANGDNVCKPFLHTDTTYKHCKTYYLTTTCLFCNTTAVAYAPFHTWSIHLTAKNYCKHFEDMFMHGHMFDQTKGVAGLVIRFLCVMDFADAISRGLIAAYGRLVAKARGDRVDDLDLSTPDCSCLDAYVLLGDEMKKFIKGCLFHWMQSVQKIKSNHLLVPPAKAPEFMSHTNALLNSPSEITFKVHAFAH